MATERDSAAAAATTAAAGLISFASLLAPRVLGATSLFVVPVYQYAIVTQFGRVVTTIQEPGLHFKTPFIQDVTMIDRRLREWDGEPSDLLTIDKENIEVNTWARWRVACRIAHDRSGVCTFESRKGG